MKAVKQIIKKNIGICILCLFGLFTPDRSWGVSAFPGAEGYGASSVGGRGGQVIKVTNLNDSGSGSLRQAVAVDAPRIIVFEVSGNIFLQSRLDIKKPYVTIAGQTAPGDGITLVGHQVTVDTHDVIIRYLRFRTTDLKCGTTEWLSWSPDVLNDDDGSYNVIIDHCTTSWGIDETLSFYRGHDFTVQWCMVTESLYDSCHYEGTPHGYGGIWGGTNASFHHNLIAHHTSRTPRFAADSYVDHRNNVIYNWGFNSAYGGEAASMNIVNNYYKYGPATSSGSTRCRIYLCDNTESQAYIEGNYVYDYPTTTTYNWLGGVQYSGGASELTLRVYTPFAAAEVNTTSAEQAYTDVIADVGASYPSRDGLDCRIISEVDNGTAAYGSSYNGGGKGIIDSQYDLCPNGGLGVCPECSDGDNDYCWLPILNSTAPPADSDGDGMPDEWELAYCLDPYDSNDCNDDRTGDGYTNIEEYINWLPLGEPMPPNPDLNCDDIVNFYDFSEFAEHYPSPSGGPLYDEKYDFNNDDSISIADLYYIVRDWL